MDHRDRLICALSALVRAEREARDALETAIAAGAIAPESMRIMVTDPGSAVTADDMDLAKEFAGPWKHAASHPVGSA